MNSLNPGLKTLYNNKIAFHIKLEKCQDGILHHISTEIKLFSLEGYPPNMIQKGKVDNINLSQFLHQWMTNITPKKGMINQFDDTLSHPTSTLIGSQTEAQ